MATLKEKIIKFNLSGNIEKALLLLLENGGDSSSQKEILDVQRSLQQYQGSDDAVIKNTNDYDLAVNPIMLDVTLKGITAGDKLILERYKPYRSKEDGAGTINYIKVKAGFVKEKLSPENRYNRVNEWNVTDGVNVIDIKPQTYFIHNADGGVVEPLGVPKNYADYSGIKAKQIMRFAIIDAEGNKTVGKPFLLFCNIQGDTNFYDFYYGIAYRK